MEVKYLTTVNKYPTCLCFKLYLSDLQMTFGVSEPWKLHINDACNISYVLEFFHKNYVIVFWHLHQWGLWDLGEIDRPLSLTHIQGLTSMFPLCLDLI